MRIVLGCAGVGLALVVWQVAASRLDNAVLLPGPWAVLVQFRETLREGTLMADVLSSLRRVFVGFALAAVVAIPLALVLGAQSSLRSLIVPVLALLRPIPPIAWIPLTILWLGLGDRTGYAITAIAAFFPLFLNTIAAVLALEPQHLTAARTLGATPAALLWRIYLPASLPQIWTGLRIALGQAWMAVVTAELVAARAGLGFMIQVNRLNLETGRVIVGMATIGLIGAGMTALLAFAERWVIAWRSPFPLR